MTPTPAALRHGGRAELAAALQATRAHLLRLWQAYGAGLRGAGFEVRYLPELNPPLWELGHVAWFEEYWTSRNPARLQGAAAPDSARGASVLPGADALYHSSQVAHTRRWHLALPDEARTLRYAEQVRERSLALLAGLPESDEALYFHRLCLGHEAMHAEAWAYMAQMLGLPLGDALAQPAPAAMPDSAAGEWARPAQPHTLGWAGPGFAFDNELQAQPVELAAHRIDRAPVTWGRYLPFMEAGGYDDQALWSPEGWAWRQRQPGHPRALQRDEDTGQWQRAQFGQWVPLDAAQPALHLSWHEAQAWCRFAGRRLPSEAEWEAAALAAGASGEPFHWGQVWEWTASPFQPYPGFEPHPYRDYSQPWFDGRPVLRGASFATLPCMKHPRYRNYFSPERADVFAGFRSCALG